MQFLLLAPCVLLALGLLGACDQRSAPPTELDGAVSTAMRQVLGRSASPEELIAQKKLAEHWPERSDAPEQERMRHVLLGRHVLPFEHKPVRVLLVYASQAAGAGANCNACRPELSFFEFQVADSKRRTLTMASVAAVSLGYGGEAPRYKVELLSGKKYVVIFTWDEYGQGVHTLLSMLAPINGGMRVVFAEQMRGNYDQVIGSSGATVHVEWSTRYNFKRGVGDYPDLQLERDSLDGHEVLLGLQKGPLENTLATDSRMPSQLTYRFDWVRCRYVVER